VHYDPSWSSKLNDSYLIWKPIFSFLLVISSNLSLSCIVQPQYIRDRWTMDRWMDGWMTAITTTRPLPVYSWQKMTLFMFYCVFDLCCCGAAVKGWSSRRWYVSCLHTRCQTCSRAVSAVIRRLAQWMQPSLIFSIPI